jgi:hypothetical protein
MQKNLDGWEIRSFIPNHSEFQQPVAFSLWMNADGSVVSCAPEIQQKIEAGLAFILHYDGDNWELREGTGSGKNVDGIAFWGWPEGMLSATEFLDRKESFIAFLRTYNQWSAPVDAAQPI